MVSFVFWQEGPKRMQAPLAYSYPYGAIVSAFHVPFEFIVEVLASSGHDYHNNLVLHVLYSVCQLIVRFVVENVVTVYARESSAFRLADGVILPDSAMAS